MDKKKLSQYSITNFKRKRKLNTETSLFNTVTNGNDSHNYKRLIMEDDCQSFTDSSSNSNMAQNYQNRSQKCNNIVKREKLSILDYDNRLSSDDESESILIDKKSSFIKQKAEKTCKNSLKTVKTELIDRNMDFNEPDTFCVDMSRYRSFTSSKKYSSLLNTDFNNFHSSLPSKVETIISPPRAQRNRRNRTTQIYKPHRHNKSVTVTLIPCKGPACTSQICCAQFCSQMCYSNQMRPIGTGCMKNSLMDYESTIQQEINVTDYGLSYPDHTYCRDHKNIYFSSDLSIDSPPYCDFVEKLFYDEKEMRIKNPRPEPNINGDPISTNGYNSHLVSRRGRPKRSTVIGLLDPYIFHPTTDVVYTPFIFKENIIEADRLGSQLHNDSPIKHAIRQCSNLYKDVRADVPHEVIYANSLSLSQQQQQQQNDVGVHSEMFESPSSLSSSVKRELNIAEVRHCSNSAMDDLFEEDDDDDEDEDDDDFSLQ